MLTDAKLRVMKPRRVLYRVADANGLCIEVPTSGARLWRFRYRFNGKASMLSLGEYPAVSLVDARARRDEARKLLNAGTNPADAARAAKVAQVEYAQNTFGSVAAELIDKREREGKSAGTIYRERQWLKNDLAPYLGTLPIKDVTAPVLLAALRKIESRAPETAHRARGLCVQVFRYAVATGRAERNVADDTRGALTTPTSGHFAAVTDPEQVAPLLRALWSYQGTPAVMAALKLAPLVFVRPGELRTMRWADVDLDAAEWRYTTSKTGTAHIVPLAAQVVDVLRDLHPYTSRSEYVFPNERSAHRPMSENAVNVALRTMGVDRDTMTGHGFRAMARTMLDEVLGFRPDYIEQQLAHAVRDPLGRAYNRTAHLAERKKMMQAWADYLDALRTSANVVPIKRKA
ncbi:MAG: integrase arm-type DNA-binding domain-containing protein [Rudaea sp.]|uniref:tyrosine-type recombinase/integrase n=1 Tax=Rudaea sp. TaxID=2136325 RepID=UPI0039E4CF51